MPEGGLDSGAGSGGGGAPGQAPGIPPAGGGTAGTTGAPGGGTPTSVVGPTPSPNAQLPRWIGTFAGRNDKSPATHIGEHECDENENLLIDRKTLRLRGGKEVFLNTLSATSWTPLGIERVYNLRPGNPYTWIAGAFDGTNSIRTSRSGAWATMLTGFQTGGTVEFVAARGATYIFFGHATEVPRKVTGADSVANVPWVPTIRPSVGVFHKKRMFVNDVNNPGRIWLSDTDTPDTMRDQTSATVATEGGYIDYIVPDGDTIVQLASFGQFLVIFSERSIHFLSGTTFSNFTINHGFAFGTKSPRSVVLCENDLWFMDSNGTVRMISGSQANINSIISTGVPGYYVEPLSQAVFSAPAASSASADVDVYTTSYVGNGTSQTIATDIPWNPSVTIIRCRGLATNAAGVWRLSNRDSSTNSMYMQESFNYTNLITAMSASGVSVGDGVEVNSNGITYDLIAFRTGTNFVLGSYTGNGSGTQTVPTGLTEVKAAMVCGPSSVLKDTLVWYDVQTTPANCFVLNSSNILGAPLGFTVDGTDLEVSGTAAGTTAYNFLGTTYYYLAWGAGSNVHTQAWVGTGADDRVITTGVGIPEWMLLQTEIRSSGAGGNSVGAWMRIAGYDTTDVAGQVISGSPAKPDCIQELGDGFIEVGTIGNENEGGLEPTIALMIGSPTETGNIGAVCATFHDRRYWLFYPEQGGQRNTKTLCWEFRELPFAGSRWTAHTNLEAGAVITQRGRTDPERILILDSSTPKLWVFPEGTTDDGSAITFSWKSRAFDFSEPLWDKGVEGFAPRLFAWAGTLTVRFFVNLLTSIAETFSIAYTGTTWERGHTSRTNPAVQGNVIQVSMSGSSSAGFELGGMEFEPTRKRRSDDT